MVICRHIVLFTAYKISAEQLNCQRQFAFPTESSSTYIVGMEPCGDFVETLKI